MLSDNSIKTDFPSGDVVFSKNQILSMNRYRSRRDLLAVLLNEAKSYTTSGVDELISQFMKGEVH